MMPYLVMGVAASFNVLIIFWKWSRTRYLDAILDGSVLFLLGYAFKGTLGGMVVATVGSAIVSLYLLLKPPKINLEDTE